MAQSIIRLVVSKSFTIPNLHLSRGKPGAVAMARPSGINAMPHGFLLAGFLNDRLAQ